MQGYASKKTLIVEIEKTAALFINEFLNVEEDDKDKLIGDVDRTPAQMIAYQLGWLDLNLSKLPNIGAELEKEERGAIKC